MWWQILAADVLVSFALKAGYCSVSEPLNTLPSNGSPTEVTQPYLCASSFARFAPDSLDLLNYCIYVVEVATIRRFLKCERLSWMWRELKEWGFARRKWDSPLTGDWGAGGQRSVLGCFAPSVTPPFGCFFLQLQTLTKASEVSSNVQPGQAAMGMLMGTAGEAESTPELPQVSVSHGL